MPRSIPGEGLVQNENLQTENTQFKVTHHGTLFGSHQVVSPPIPHPGLQLPTLGLGPHSVTSAPIL